MIDSETFIVPKVPEEFAAHAIFQEMAKGEEFYEVLANMVWPQTSRTRQLLGNLDSSFFDSLAGTIESIRMVLLAGRIADAFTLLRRFNETTWLHVYVMLRLEEKNDAMADLFSTLDDLDSNQAAEAVAQALQQGYVEEIEDWLGGDKSMPELRVFSQWIISSPNTMALNLLFDRDQYRQISSRANDHVHVNFFRNLRLNNTRIGFEPQMAWLEQLAHDFRDLFVRHVAFVFGIHPEYMRSSDYVDALECGVSPAEGSEYWVAPFVQELFNEMITPLRADVTDFIKQNCAMQLA